MDCPKCLAKTAVKETRKRDIYNAWVSSLRQDWPDMVLRRRWCSACKHRFSTVEIPVEDLKVLISAPPTPADCEGPEGGEELRKGPKPSPALTGGGPARTSRGR
jgi:hypothetical protein